MTDERKANILRIVDEVWNKGNLDAMDEIAAEDCVRHRPPFPDVEGLDAYKKYIAALRTTFPDFHITFHEITIEGDLSAYRWTWTGTHSGESEALPGPPTGKKVTVTGCSMTRSKDGKAIEEWSYADNLGMLQQLGIIPPLG